MPATPPVYEADVPDPDVDRPRSPRRNAFDPTDVEEPALAGGGVAMASVGTVDWWLGADAENRSGPLAFITATLTWFVFPAFVYLFLLVTSDAGPPAGCAIVDDAQCRSEHASLVALVGDVLPFFGLGVAVAVGTALTIRALSSEWRPFGTGFASAVVGGAIGTLLYTAFVGPT
jgi:hypothetical protein